MTDDPRPEDKHREESSEEGILGEIAPAAGEEKPPDAPPPLRRHRRRSLIMGCLLALLGALLGAGVALLMGRHFRGRSEAPADVLPPPVAGVSRLVFSPTPERPEQTPDIIPAESKAIYCFYQLDRVPPDAPLAARWWRDGEDLGRLELHELRREEGADHAVGRFTIKPPAPTAAGETQTPFPPGLYEVELTSEAAPDVSARASFMVLPRAARILAGGGEPEGPPVVRSLRTAAAVSEDGEAVDAKTSFAGPERVYVVFRYAGVMPGAVLTVRWYLDERELEDARAEIPIPAAEGVAHAWLQADAGTPLPPGQYRVAVFLGTEDEPLATTGFTITSRPDDRSTVPESDEATPPPQ